MEPMSHMTQMTLWLVIAVRARAGDADKLRERHKRHGVAPAINGGGRAPF